ncbi:type II secretion system F family protein [Acetobacter sp. LMG 32666]|uniref:type II secretion system F family protein n=1 Tax=Acetobacter sp. LMG 32666 TaxID=2959295 RepID=UPI0030C836C3
MSVQIIIGFALFFFLGVLGVLYNQSAKKFQYRKNRIQAVCDSVVKDKKSGNKFDFYHILSKFGQFIINANVIPQKTVDEMLRSISKKPEFSGGAFYIFMGSKVLFFCIGLVISLYYFFFKDTGIISHIVLPIAFPIVGIVLPDFILNSLHKKYLEGVEKGMPQALDLLIICAESGMPMEVSMIRVARDMQQLNKDVANEFRLTVQDMQLISDRYEVFRQMARRTGLSVMKQLSSILIQSLETGTPLAEAFRTLSADVKQDAMLRYQTRAAQLPVFMTVPMIVFILPVLFIVVLGPVAVQFMK